MQMYIVILSGSIPNLSTVHLNGLTPHMTFSIKTCISQTLEYSSRVSPPNTGLLHALQLVKSLPFHTNLKPEIGTLFGGSLSRLGPL